MNTDKTKRIIWGMDIIPAQGFALVNYLNDFNFQPGKFFVVSNEFEHTVYYVKSEEDL